MAYYLQNLLMESVQTSHAHDHQHYWYHIITALSSSSHYAPKKIPYITFNVKTYLMQGVKNDASHTPPNLSSASCHPDLLRSKLIVSCPRPVDLRQLTSRVVHSFSKYHVHKCANRQTNKMTGWEHCAANCQRHKSRTKRERLIAVVQVFAVNSNKWKLARLAKLNSIVAILCIPQQDRHICTNVYLHYTYCVYYKQNTETQKQHCANCKQSHSS